MIWQPPMIKVTVELVPDGDELLTKTLAVLSIANDNSGTSMTGNYDLTLIQYDRQGGSFKTEGRLTDYDRDKPVAILVRRAFEQIVKDPRGMACWPSTT
jgi:hypothetical protein